MTSKQTTKNQILRQSQWLAAAVVLVMGVLQYDQPVFWAWVVIAGEAGPEPIIARGSGMVLPSRIFQQFGPRQSMPLPISMGRSSTVNNNNSRNLTVESLNFGEGMSAVEQRAVENLVQTALQRILGGL